MAYMTFTDETPYAIFTEHFSLFSLYSLKKFLSFLFRWWFLYVLCTMERKLDRSWLDRKFMRNAFFAWDMVHNDTWYINLYKHYFLKKPKALRIPLNGALIALHSPPILKEPCSILGKFSNFAPSWLGTRDRSPLSPPPLSRWPCLQASVAHGERIWNDACMQFCHNLTAAVAFYNNSHKAKAPCPVAAICSSACSLLHR